MSSQARGKNGPRTWDSPEYAAFCESQARRVRIGYAGSASRAVACVTHVWTRDDQDIKRGPIMSSSSGTKENTINLVLAVFGANPHIERVALLVLNRTPFLIAQIGPHWFDAGSNPVRQVDVMPLAEGHDA